MSIVSSRQLHFLLYSTSSSRPVHRDLYLLLLLLPCLSLDSFHVCTSKDGTSTTFCHAWVKILQSPPQIGNLGSENRNLLLNLLCQSSISQESLKEPTSCHATLKSIYGSLFLSTSPGLGFLDTPAILKRIYALSAEVEQKPAPPHP